MTNKLFTREALLIARERYLQHNITAPQQFNIAYHVEDGWSCEFHEDEGSWSEPYTRWISGESVLDLFFSCDATTIDLDSWDDTWNDE